HIVLTHLDCDHAGGIDDFPEATLHVLAKEREAANARNSLRDRIRYRPTQWARREHSFVSYETPRAEPWFGFEAGGALEGLPPEILLVPLYGHTLGHAGVAIDTGARWLLHAGDAYFFHGELDLVRPHCTPALRMFQRLMDSDHALRVQNQFR